MNTCVKCKQVASFQIQEWYCEQCFCGVIEKRIKKYLRDYPISKGEELIVLGELTFDTLKRIIGGLPVKIIKVMTKKELNAVNAKNKEARIVLPWTLDQEIGEFLTDFMHGKLHASAEKKVLKLFVPITNKELRKYAELRKLQLPELRSGEISEYLNEMETKYASSKYSLFKSANELRNILQNANIKNITVNKNKNGFSASNKRRTERKNRIARHKS